MMVFAFQAQGRCTRRSCGRFRTFGAFPTSRHGHIKRFPRGPVETSLILLSLLSLERVCDIVLPLLAPVLFLFPLFRALHLALTFGARHQAGRGSDGAFEPGRAMNGVRGMTGGGCRVGARVMCMIVVMIVKVVVVGGRVGSGMKRGRHGRGRAGGHAGEGSQGCRDQIFGSSSFRCDSRPRFRGQELFVRRPSRL